VKRWRVGIVKLQLPCQLVDITPWQSKCKVLYYSHG
jgi:hypothetical protein